MNPVILRHPANVNIITHAENVRKSRKFKDKVIEKDVLFEMIEKYTFDWHGQNACLEAIAEYRLKEQKSDRKEGRS